MSVSYRVALLLLAAVAVMLASANPAAAQFDQLAARVPSTANTITLLNGERLMNSPIAVREGWKDRYSKAFAAGLHSIPPDTKLFVLASELNYEFMQPAWRVGVAETTNGRSMDSLAKMAHGSVDTIDGKPALALRDNSYLVDIGSKSFAIMAPANRQAVARWLKDTDEKTKPTLSNYLEATLVAAQTSEVVIAFDLEDAIPPDVISGKLATSSALAGSKVDVAAAAKALASVRGVAVEVSVKDAVIGRIMVHFNGNATVLGPVAKPLLLELMGDLGARIADVEAWKVEVEPNRITFQGPLSEDGMKRFFALIEQPTSALLATDEKPPMTASQSQSDPVVYSSQRYFTSINAVLEDARKEYKDAKTFGQSAMWFDNWARKIDKLPMLNVDPDLVSFGQYASSQLRNISASLKGIGINSAQQTAQIYQQTSTSVSGYGGYWGGGYSYYSEWRNVDGERRAVRANERAKGATSAQGIAKQLADDTVKMRATLTEKYKTNF